ncbi:MAG TPA: hypothetical protein PLD47_16315 [Aggregatilineales bacterium]|nr:hypothetical protein [Anaerolineales bacterium]HRE49292.1 hypothetical protein [Aggregatilineales bacterium]
MGDSRHWRWVVFVFMALVVGACRSAPSATPTRPPAATEPPVRFVTVVVTRVPTATPTIVPTATFPFAMNTMIGTWRLDLNHQIIGNAVFSDVRFFGSATLEVDFDASVRGTLEFFPSVQQPPCVASVLDSDPLTAAVTGTLRMDAASGEVIAALTITPDNPTQETGLSLYCVTFSEALIIRQPLLWEALGASGGLNVALPMKIGYVRRASADLDAPTFGALRGVLLSEITVGR